MFLDRTVVCVQTTGIKADAAAAAPRAIREGVERGAARIEPPLSEIVNYGEVFSVVFFSVVLASPPGEVVVVSLVDFSLVAGSEGAPDAPVAPVAPDPPCAPVAPGAPCGPGSLAGAGVVTVSVSLHPPAMVPTKNKTPMNAAALPIFRFIFYLVLLCR